MTKTIRTLPTKSFYDKVDRVLRASQKLVFSRWHKHDRLGRVDLGGRPPKSPTDPDVQNSSIRFFASCRYQRDPRSFVNRYPVSVYLACFRTTVHEDDASFPPQGPSGWFPCFIGTMRHCDFLTVFSPHFVSFAWRYLGASEFRPRAASDAEPTDHPGVCGTGCSRSGRLQGTSPLKVVTCLLGANKLMLSW